MLDRRQITELASALAAENPLSFRNLCGGGPVKQSWHGGRIIMSEACGKELILHVLAVLPHSRFPDMVFRPVPAAMRHHG